MAEYTPTDDHMRSLFCQGYAQGDFDKHDQAWAAWEKWLAAHDARVRRDAAREALDGLATELMEAARDCASDGDHGGAGAWRNASAHTYHHRDTHYPETED